jgi:hypothetical protein
MIDKKKLDIQTKNKEAVPYSFRSLVGSVIVKNLKLKGYSNLIYKTHQELDLTNQVVVEQFFNQESPDKGLIDTIKKKVGYDGELYFNEIKPDGIMIKFTDSFLNHKPNWKRSVELEDGIERVYEMFLINKDE